jgi:hypothetical protein
MSAIAAMPRKPRWCSATWAIILLSSAALAFAVWAAFNWFEIVDDTEWVGVRGEAATNPLLALERLLAERGHDVKRVNRAAGIDGALAAPGTQQPAIMFIAASRLPQMTPARLQALDQWVRAGGVMIVEAERITLEDPLLAHWRLDRKRVLWYNGQYIEVDRKLPPAQWPRNSPVPLQDKDASGDDPASRAQELDEPRGPAGSQSGGGGKGRGRMPFGDFGWMPEYRPAELAMPDGYAFMMRFSPTQNLAPLQAGGASAGHMNPSAAIPAAVRPSQPEPLFSRDAVGARVAELSVGKGRVVVVSSFEPFRWKNLLSHDHAEFVAHLVAPAEGAVLPVGADALKPMVVMATMPDGGGFAAWLREYAWTVLVTALLLLAGWLARVVPRFGPLLPPLETSRRSLVEHFSACGRWFARRGEWQTLVEPVRRRFMTQLLRRYPKVSAMSGNQRTVWLARHFNVSEEAAARTLVVPVSSQREAMEVLSRIRTLRKHLSIGERRSEAQRAPEVGLTTAHSATSPTASSSASTFISS